MSPIHDEQLRQRERARDAWRILFVLPESPLPSNSGPRHLMMGILKEASSFAECEVVGFVSGDTSMAEWSAFKREFPSVHLRSLFRSSGRGCSFRRISRLLTFRPVSSVKFEDSELHDWLIANASDGRYSVVHFASFNLVQYRKDVVRTAAVLVPWDAFSMDARREFLYSWSIGSRVRGLWKWVTFARYEGSAYRQFSKVCPVSELDATCLRRRDRAMDVVAIPVAVRPEFLAGDVARGVAAGRPTRIVFAGRLNLPDVASALFDALKVCLPWLVLMRHQCDVAVWGDIADSRLRRLLGRHPWIRCVPHVADYRAFLCSIDVYVYPRRGGAGIQTKVQEAMAVGLPVVARPSTLVPLKATHGIHALSCDGDPEILEAIRELHTNPAMRRSVGSRASEHIASEFSEQRLRESLRAVYRDAIEKEARRDES